MMDKASSGSGTLLKAIAFRRQGDLEKAITLYRSILASQPENPDCLHLLGLALFERGDSNEGCGLLKKACDISRNNVLFLTDYAACLNKKGSFEEAVVQCRRGLELDPKNAYLYFMLAQSYRGLGNIDDIKKSLKSALACKPDFFEAHINLAETYKSSGDSAKALEHITIAVRIKPDSAEIRNAAGILSQSMGDIVKAEAYFRTAASLRPDFADAHNNLGVILWRKKDILAALSSFTEAVRLNPGFTQALYNTGVCLRELEQFDEAVAYFRLALQQSPLHTEALSNCGEALLATGFVREAEQCFWTIVGHDPRCAKAYSNLLFAMNYNEAYGPSRLFEDHVAFGKTFQEADTARPEFTNKRVSGKRLRIGYVSADFCSHPVARFIEPVFLHHNKNDFEIHALSSTAAEDGQTAFFKSHCDVWHDIAGVPDTECAETIRRLGIDILVDLSGHSAENRLPVFAKKPAPVLITYLGYPNTTGLSAIDYRITDATADPPSEAPVHSEKLFRLPHCFCCFSPPAQAPEVSGLSCHTAGYVTFGSVHPLSRLNEKVIALWCTILQTLPLSHLVLARTTLKGRARQRLSALFESNGVASRVHMRDDVPSAGHLALYDDIDIALDTFPWSGHTTACEALWMGRPVVTLLGDRHAGRMVASVLETVGLQNLVGRSAQEYISIARDLALSIDRLEALRRSLRTTVRTSGLCDGRRFTQGLEAAYRTMWRAWCENG